jgi:uncharacterized RDD family membrane protein YckC
MKYPYTPRRVYATLVDYTLIFALSFAYLYLAGEQQDDGSYRVSGWPALAPVALWFLYFVIAERYLKGTFGHQLFGLKVVSMNGNQLGLGQVCARRICDALEISWCFGLVAYLLVRSTDRNQRLGDLLAKTFVVGAKDTYPYTKDFQFDFEQK